MAVKAALNTLPTRVNIMISRRRFNQGLVSLAFAGLSKQLQASPAKLNKQAKPFAYGELLEDPNGLIDLPAGFSYEVISSLNEKMTDGLTVPDSADGMGCFYLDEERIVLVRNHELMPSEQVVKPANKQMVDLAYDNTQHNTHLPGGTSNIIYNHKKHKVEQQFMSLLGTIRNCSGGITPWNTWLTCEESTLKASDKLNKDHGYVFEVPADATSLIEADPIIAMGRFNHEAACVDPRTGIVYMTEDRGDSLLYRFIPNIKEKLHQGGRLQALAIHQQAQFDTRNWHKKSMILNQELETVWIDLHTPESPNDDLRSQGFKAGATLFARGEGIHWADNELYFCCTNGGTEKLGQIMRYVPSISEGSVDEGNMPGRLSLFVESDNKQSLNYADNITIAPNGHLIVCEDQYTEIVDNHLKGVTSNGQTYDFARIKIQTEPAGACFSPDGKILFVNLYSPTKTLAITGPWQGFKS